MSAACYASTCSGRTRAQETVPEKYGEYEYWTRQKTAGPRAVLLRRLAAGGSEEVVLDSNLLPEGSELSQVSVISLSDTTARRLIHASDCCCQRPPWTGFVQDPIES